MRPRGIWELSTPRLEDLQAALARTSGLTVTETFLQYAGFDGPAVASLVGLTVRHALIVVESVLGERRAHAPPHLELVWTGPEALDAHARGTRAVVRELLESAEQSVLVAGFAFWGAAEIFERLYQRAKVKPLAIEFFIHVDPTGANVQMTPQAFFQHTWKWKDIPIGVYRDARPEAASMHAKCVVVDEVSTFLTSANFTSAAHDRNVEMGVRIDDPSFARQVAKQWHLLVGNGAFVPVTP